MASHNGQENIFKAILRVRDETSGDRILPSLRSGGQGVERRRQEHAFDTRFEKSFRETLKPLKSLKTAKSYFLRPQGYQRLSNAHDFAGETFSFHFRFALASREILGALGGASGRVQKI